MINNTTCCFTGHRIIKKEHLDILPQNLKKLIKTLACDGICTFLSGGALGFDTIAAEAVLSLKKELPQIRLILALPCTEQADRWKASDKIRYEKIKNNADEIIYVSDFYTSDCMLKRNRFMVDNSSNCIFYMTYPKGGTAYTVRYALENNLKMHNIITL